MSAREHAAFFGGLAATSRGLVILPMVGALLACDLEVAASGRSDTDRAPDAPVMDDARVSEARDAGGLGEDAGATAFWPDGGSGVMDASARVPDAGEPPDSVEAGVTQPLDRFGVAMLYPTVHDGREWYLPDDADQASDEWQPSSGSRGRMTATGEPGVFHMGGGAGPRLPVRSPDGKAWFRNIEATAYFKLIRRHDEGSYSGFQIIARGEAHRTGTRMGSSVNEGVAAPPGTTTGPGFPLDPASEYNAHCLAASYHGGVTRDGRVNLVKEVSHAAGYTGQHGNVKPFPEKGEVPTDAWFGYKFVVQNRADDQGVHLEAWLDLDADGHWQKIVERDDTGGWEASNAAIDGCDAPPFGYATDQIITWAGPYVLFRIDYLETDAKWFSVREIAPLP